MYSYNVRGFCVYGFTLRWEKLICVQIYTVDEIQHQNAIKVSESRLKIYESVILLYVHIQQQELQLSVFSRTYANEAIITFQVLLWSKILPFLDNCALFDVILH